MTERTMEVVIPFRDRGTDLRRAANLEVVMAWWWSKGINPKVVDDGLEGDAQFNRHKAYNRAVADSDADVFVFTEADMLIPLDQIRNAFERALQAPGLIVPFSQYRYLSDASTAHIRDNYQDLSRRMLANWWRLSPKHPVSIFQMNPESVMDHGRSIGAVNVVSRETLEITGGFTEATQGNWYDDRIIEAAFTYLTGNTTRYVNGPAVHMYHLPGWTGDHLTAEDRAATAHNRELLHMLLEDIEWGHKDVVRKMMETRV